MILRYLGNELYKRSPNTVIAFSRRDCAEFLHVCWTFCFAPPFKEFNLFLLNLSPHRYLYIRALYVK